MTNIEQSQREFMDWVEEKEDHPFTAKQLFIAASLGAASWGVVGLMFWAAFTFAGWMK